MPQDEQAASLHETDQERSPDYLEGRQDGLAYAAQVLDAYRQRYASTFCMHASEHFRIVIDGLRFGTMMLDLTGGAMPPRPPKETNQ